MLSAQLGCSPRASCLGLVTPRAVERADLVPTCNAGEEGPPGAPYSSLAASWGNFSSLLLGQNNSQVSFSCSG